MASTLEGSHRPLQQLLGGASTASMGGSGPGVVTTFTLLGHLTAASNVPASYESRAHPQRERLYPRENAILNRLPRPTGWSSASVTLSTGLSRRSSLR